jgi:hypothetical protein
VKGGRRSRGLRPSASWAHPRTSDRHSYAAMETEDHAGAKTDGGSTADRWSGADATPLCYCRRDCSVVAPRRLLVLFLGRIRHRCLSVAVACRPVEGIKNLSRARTERRGTAARSRGRCPARADFRSGARARASGCRYGCRHPAASRGDTAARGDRSGRGRLPVGVAHRSAHRGAQACAVMLRDCWMTRRVRRASCPNLKRTDPRGSPRVSLCSSISYFVIRGLAGASGFHRLYVNRVKMPQPRKSSWASIVSTTHTCQLTGPKL